jgi:hypothetical protein
MTTHPATPELVDAVIGFIERTAAPNLKDHDAFLARVAVNVLGVVRRELEQGPALEDAARARLAALLSRDGGYAELNTALCEAIRAGAVDATTPGLLAHLKAETIDRVRIDQPKYAGLHAAVSQSGGSATG